MARWDEPGFRGSEEQVQQTTFAATVEAKVIAPVAVPPAVVIKPTTQIEAPPATLLPRKLPAEQPTPLSAEKTDVSWTSADAAVSTKTEPSSMPLIPVLSEHCEHKPSAPPALNGLPPLKPRRVAKLRFEEQP